MTRALRLAKETLTDLSADDLSAVGGGAIPTDHCLTGAYPTLPVRWCVEYTLDQTW